MNKKGAYHISVMPEQVITFLRPKPGGIYIDATFGGGGHTRTILEHSDKAKVIALDWDLVALERNGDPLVAQYPDRLQLVWTNFAHIQEKMKKMRMAAVDGIIADFGTSQDQLMHRTGFSFARNSFLDMRMSPAHQRVRAADLIAKMSEAELITLFRDYGQEPRARAIAQAIVLQRKKKPIRTTQDLVNVVESVVGGRLGKRIHPATKVFQALRIAVNHELENIRAFLQAAVRLLKPGGRLVCISFHSLEDRLVKQFFKDKLSEGLDEYALVTPKALAPTQEELQVNPSARSAKMRVLERREK